MNLPINLDTVYQPSSKVVPRKIRNKLIIVPIEDGVANFDDAMFSFNETGTVIWEYIEKKLNLGQIIAALAEEYNADTEKIETGVLSLVTILLEKGIISPCPN